MASAKVAAMPAQLLQMIQLADMVSRLDMVRALAGAMARLSSGGERVFMVPVWVVGSVSEEWVREWVQRGELKVLEKGRNIRRSRS